VKDYLAKIAKLNKLKADIEWLYTSPTVADPAIASKPLVRDQLQLQAELKQLGPLAESIIQAQLNAILLEKGLTPVPPPLYHVTDLPYALIISPRDVIRQDYDISLLPDMTMPEITELEQRIEKELNVSALIEPVGGIGQDYDISLLPDMTMPEITELEQRIEKELNVSALIEPVGGIGVYPTMVMATSSITWLPEVVAHEWTHNYLTLHPLGMGYFASGEMRTINETTASIVGVELSRALLAQYFPQDLPPEPLPTWPLPAPFEEIYPGLDRSQPPAFNFRVEMHTTRVEVDRLLVEGKIEEAEQYMESRVVPG